MSTQVERVEADDPAAPRRPAADAEVDLFAPTPPRSAAPADERDEDERPGGTGDGRWTPQTPTDRGNGHLNGLAERADR